MKLTNIHLIFIVIGVLMLINLGVSIKEGMEVNKKDIEKEDEDKFILKSQIVPPVCPKCPDVTVCPEKEQKCPPCPPCGRCQYQPFENKTFKPSSCSYSKYQTQQSLGSQYLPRPMLTDFSQF